MDFEKTKQIRVKNRICLSVLFLGIQHQLEQKDVSQLRYEKVKHCSIRAWALCFIHAAHAVRSYERRS